MKKNNNLGKIIPYIDNGKKRNVIHNNNGLTLRKCYRKNEIKILLLILKNPNKRVYGLEHENAWEVNRRKSESSGSVFPSGLRVRDVYHKREDVREIDQNEIVKTEMTEYLTGIDNLNKKDMYNYIKSNCEESSCSDMKLLFKKFSKFRKGIVVLDVFVFLVLLYVLLSGALIPVNHFLKFFVLKELYYGIPYLIVPVFIILFFIKYKIISKIKGDVESNKLYYPY
ncbi:uncharacterized protein PMUG01_13011500 [Plasmodium malariae]|uniref:Uncharacterized protein n=1 Tax=Plasmodium malariae TaxID=5858 RepID=A0A1D3TC54_PLAMA|nr:uncharacterized protein PMUG01_13011500 [Plasmodium malariae]SCP02468.1 hypothetical protein PMUG01_13011500 [Plasmodium malariae]